MYARCFYEVIPGIRCKSNIMLREVEFRHPYFQEKNLDSFLCEMHFNIIFEYERETDRKFVRELSSAEAHYRKLKAETRRAVSQGVGNDNFDWETWNGREYRKVEVAKEKLKNFRRNICAYEFCQNDVRKNKKPFVIRIYPFNQFAFLSLIYCSEKHWEAIKRRIGIIHEKVKQPFEVKTLDSFG